MDDIHKRFNDSFLKQKPTEVTYKFRAALLLTRTCSDTYFAPKFSTMALAAWSISFLAKPVNGNRQTISIISETTNNTSNVWKKVCKKRGLHSWNSLNLNQQTDSQSNEFYPQHHSISEEQKFNQPLSLSLPPYLSLSLPPFLSLCLSLPPFLSPSLLPFLSVSVSLCLCLSLSLSPPLSVSLSTNILKENWEIRFRVDFCWKITS